MNKCFFYQYSVAVHIQEKNGTKFLFHFLSVCTLPLSACISVITSKIVAKATQSLEVTPFVRQLGIYRMYVDAQSKPRNAAAAQLP